MKQPLPSVQFVECPRDAMQGWHRQIATDQKIAYINQLLRVGFHTLDFGSFVSPKAIPQMADTKEVLRQLDWQQSATALLAIVANERGAAEAAVEPGIRYLGFPLSVSEKFQQRNTNASIAQARERVKHINQIANDAGKELVVYLSMAFGNIYGDAYSAALVSEHAKVLAGEGIGIISLADTVGLALPAEVHALTQTVISQLPGVQVGVHLHASKDGVLPKLEAALRAGCTRIDGALHGFGGCPMAKNDLVGNMDSALMIPYLQSRNLLSRIDTVALQKAAAQTLVLFS